MKSFVCRTLLSHPKLPTHFSSYVNRNRKDDKAAVFVLSFTVVVHLCILVQTLETTIFVLGRLLPVTFSIHPLDGFWQKIDIKQRNRIEFPCSPIHCHFFILHHIPFTVQITKKKSPEKQTWLQYKTRDLFFFTLEGAAFKPWLLPWQLYF